MTVRKVTRKLKNGKTKIFHRAEVYINGVRVDGRCFDTSGAAHQWHDTTKARWKAGNIPGAFTPDDYTFADCLEQYRAEALPRLRKSSQQSFECRLDHFEKSPLMVVRLNDLKAHMVDAWLIWLKAQPTAKNRNRDSFRAELKYLSVILNWYRGYHDASFVVPIVTRHYEQCFFKAVTARRPDYYMRPDEVVTWLAWLKDNAKPVYYHLAVFMVLTGTRLGEAGGLHWDCVDLERREVRISRTVAWDHWTKEPYMVDGAKNEDSIRCIPLTGMLVEMLTTMRQTAKDGRPVFHRDDGRLLSDNGVRNAFNRAFKACGLPWTATHICRHTHATISLMANDGNLSAVQATLGHRDQKITQKYAKVIAMRNRLVVERTEEMLGLSANHAQNHATI